MKNQSEVLEAVDDVHGQGEDDGGRGDQHRHMVCQLVAPSALAASRTSRGRLAMAAWTGCEVEREVLSRW